MNVKIVFSRLAFHCQAELPKDPALIGFSIAPVGPNAVEFHLFVPSAVGPVFEKVLGPVFSSLRPAGKP